jgi:hypothetical protein
MMETNQLSVISLLADMGNGEVKDSRTDLPKVNGGDAPQSNVDRILHWDAEWHFDPEGVTFQNKALGGHLVVLGLKQAAAKWDESPYKILEWGREQGAIMGFCHMQYLEDTLGNGLTCCTPIDFPVEMALGTIDFLAEDVWLNDASVRAWYRILNCGFRPGWAAGTDFPCNNAAPPGSLLTYVNVREGPFTYGKWIEGIRQGRTVVTTNGHAEFLDLKINGKYGPGDEMEIAAGGKVNVKVVWTSVKDQEGSIEIVCNGKVVASHPVKAGPGKPASMDVEIPVTKSSWISARRNNDRGHQSHASPVYVIVAGSPVHASREDALYFVKWIDTVLKNIEDGGPWRKYFTSDIETVRKRYLQAADIYRKIAEGAN